MKKEDIYQLVQKGYDGTKDFDAYVSEFVKKLEEENEWEMVHQIKQIQNHFKK